MAASMEAIDMENLMQVFQPNGQPFRSEEGQLCFQRKTDGMLLFVEAAEKQCDNGEQHGVAIPDKRIKWRRDAILTIIELRKKYETDFHSTTMKNEVVWKKLANEMQSKGFLMTSTQCHDKWRYLKGKYTSKKDNMGTRGTGEEPIDFEYFEVMDEFLGNKHNVAPIAIASSSRGDTVPHQQINGDDDDDGDELLEERPMKKKKLNSKVAKGVKDNAKNSLISLVQNTANRREENKERRHQELLEARQRAVDVFSAKMDSLIQHLKKPDDPL